MRPFVLACAVAGSVTVRAASLKSGPLLVETDGSGRVTRCMVAGVDVTARDGVAASGFSIADCAADGPARYAPVGCAVRETPTVIEFDGSVADVRLQARIGQAAGGFVVAGDVRDERGEDRAISVRFALPVDALGWKWSRDLNRELEITEGQTLTNAVPCGVGLGSFDLWPVNAMGSDDVTLGLATRLDQPAISRAQYNAASGLFSISFDFALTDLAKKFPRRAPFRFYVLAADNGWGLRAALGQYYATVPELFVRRNTLAGGWFAWGDILSLDPPLCDFGLRFHEAPQNQQAHEHDRKLGILSFPYIEPGMFQLHFGDFDHKPSREEIMQRLQQYAEEAQNPDTMAKLTGRQQYERNMSLAVLRSGVRDRDGNIVIAAVGQYPWVAGSRWAAQFPLVLEPDIEDGAADQYLRKMAKDIPRPEWGEGRYLDSYSAHVTRITYAPEHIAALSLPPTFDKKTKQPCQMMALAMFEYVKRLHAMLDKYQKLILVNAYGHNAPFPFHLFDVLGKEHWVPPSGRLLAKYRAMAWQRPVTDLPSYEPVGQSFLRECLVYDIFPGGYGRPNWHQEEMRPYYREVIPLLRLLDKLGWEPVPWARPNRREVIVERYGPSPRFDASPICFAIHNPFGPKVAEIAIDASRLGIPKGAWCRELLDDRPLSWTRDGDTLKLSLGMGVQDTALVAVGSAGQVARLYQLLARDRLADAGLCVREWSLRNDSPHPLAQKDRWGRNPDELRAQADSVPDDDNPLNVRLAELLREAADLQARAENPTPAKPQSVEAPAAQPVGAAVPWKETFDELSAERWSLPKDPAGIAVKDGRLTLTLAGGKKSVAITSREAFDFATRPLEFRFKFQYSHAGHQWYLMQGFRISPLALGQSNDYLLVRMDPRVKVRVENGEAPATNWQRTLTDWTQFKPNVPHDAKLRLDGEKFRLEVDGKLVGEGPHCLGFGLCYITLMLYSGHGGHGDVCWFDDIEVVEGPA